MKIVLYQPQQSNKAVTGQSSYDMLPLEMIHVAGWPVKDGHDVVLVDGSLYDQEEAHDRVLAECDGASILGVTGILGWQVTDGYELAKKVRDRHPSVRRVIGGWFTSVKPELHLQDGVFEISVQGQGEVAFRELVEAIATGSDLEEISGLCLWRDNALHTTAHRSVVGWAEMTEPAWDLIDFRPYREGQLRAQSPNDFLRMASPPWIGKKKPYVGITYFSSFGCPEPCTFCCSPLVTDRRWKAIEADRVLDDLEMLHDRWGGYDVVRFHDANFGVNQKRTRAFAEGMLSRGLEKKFGWNAFLETYSINNYDPETLDACAASGYYIAEVGAETGDQETMDSIGKPIKGEDNYEAIVKLYQRGIRSSVTFIIGMPGESESSMLKTLDQARRIQYSCPNSSVHVFPFRPIPGTPLYDESIKLGFEEPTDIHDWGDIGQYHLHQTWNIIPEPVLKKLSRLNHYGSVYKGVARKRNGLFEAAAKWRMKTGNWSLPIDAKMFGIVNDIENKLFPENKINKDMFDEAIG